MGFPLKDGKGFRPDSRLELLADVFLVVFVVGAFTFFTGLDAQVNYLASAPGDYVLSGTADSSDLRMTESDIDLLNSVNSRSLGSDAVASERLYCSELRNGVVRNLRLADRIDSSSLTSVAGGCIGSVDLFLHTQPDGSRELSQEDRDLESTGVDYTCIQYAEISASVVNGKLGGLNCWDIVDNGESFQPVDVYAK